MNWLFLLACSAEPIPVVEAVALPVVAKRTTFATMMAFGSFRLDARTTTTTHTFSGDEKQEESYSLRWNDASAWQTVRGRDGIRVEELRVWDNLAWHATGSGPFVNKGDGEPFRAALAGAWDPWHDAVGNFSNSIGFREVGTEQVEGRAATVYTLEPILNVPSRKSAQFLGVEGQVWIDQATAARIVGDVTLRTKHHERERTVSLRFSVTEIGGTPGVEPPPGVEMRVVSPALQAPDALSPASAAPTQEQP